MNETIQLTVALVVVCLISGFSLALVYDQTNPLIQEHKRVFMENSIKEVNSGCNNAIKDEQNTLGLVSQTKMGIRTVYMCKEGEKTIGYVLEVHASGFADIIEGLVGVEVSDDKTVTMTGMKILAHKETAGLGDKIVTDNTFVNQFKGKKSTDSFDTITAATISSKTVIKMMREAVRELEKKV